MRKDIQGDFLPRVASPSGIAADTGHLVSAFDRCFVTRLSSTRFRFCELFPRVPTGAGDVAGNVNQFHLSAETVLQDCPAIRIRYKA